jgi:glycerophosphoryl diester phosphodiesterase
VRGRPRARSAAPRTGRPYLDAVLDRPGTVLAFAHRGGAAHPDLAGLENTLTAFRHARGLGFRYLETDVHTTRDGVLLAFHDRVLDRVTGETGAVEELSLQEVRRALIGGVEPVPTLAELVDAVPDARFNVDLKSVGAVPALAAFLVERGLEDQVLVGSFSHRRLRAFRRLAGDRVATSASPVEVAAFRLVPSARLARVLTRGRVAALQVPRRVGPLEVVTRGLVRRAHAAGAHVHVWTVDDPREMRLLVDRGVDGLMTDRTDILRAVLRTGGQWEGDR